MISPPHRIKIAIFFLVAMVFIVFLATRNAQENRPTGKTPRSLYTYGGPMEAELERSESRGRRLKQQLDKEFKSLDPAGRIRFDEAINSLKDYLKELEFSRSELLWHAELEDQAIRLYRQSPPSEDEMKDLDREIDRIIADHRLRVNERRIFAHYATETIDSYLIPVDSYGGLFFQIPLDPTKNIFMVNSVGNPDLDQLVNELEQSGGKNASSLGSGDGEFRTMSRTAAGWRYEKYLMIEADSD